MFPFGVPPRTCAADVRRRPENIRIMMSNPWRTFIPVVHVLVCRSYAKRHVWSLYREASTLCTRVSVNLPKKVVCGPGIEPLPVSLRVKFQTIALKMFCVCSRARKFLCVTLCTRGIYIAEQIVLTDQNERVFPKETTMLPLLGGMEMWATGGWLARIILRMQCVIHVSIRSTAIKNLHPSSAFRALQILLQHM